jgi:hypothetical protein
VTYRTQWYTARADHLTKVAPAQAGAMAAQGAARAAAEGIGGQGEGTLAREVSIARRTGPLSWLVGSSLPYAAIEHYGGTIQGNPTLYISARKNHITATASSVYHVGKGYFNAGLAAFPALFIARMKAIG